MSCNLDKVNVCDISNCIINVSGMVSNSTSPTDIWFLTFHDTYYKGDKIDKAFLKLFVDINSLPPITFSTSHIYSEDIIPSISGLNYELIVYRDIIRPLVDNNICPNFIKYLASGQGCSYDDILKFLQ